VFIMTVQNIAVCRLQKQKTKQLTCHMKSHSVTCHPYGDGLEWRLQVCGTRVPMLHDFASFCCQLATAYDDLPCDVSVVVQRYSWRVDCVYLLHMSPQLRSFSTMDLRASWIGQLDFELSAMLVYTSAKLRDSACLE